MAKLPGNLWQAYPLLAPQLDIPQIRPEVVLRLHLIQRLHSDSPSQLQKNYASAWQRTHIQRPCCGRSH
jgi:hypothetical protein